MREIKFRAFDDGKMIYEKDIQHLSLEDFEVLRLAKFFCNVRNDSKIMQFTGLKDKNGKEIYEGDIINGRYGISVVRFIDCGFHPLCGEINSEKDPDIIEVIGNIHENPYLLK